MGSRSRKKLTARQEAARARVRGPDGAFQKAPPPGTPPRHTFGARAARAREVAGGELAFMLGGGTVDPDDHLFRSTREGIRDLPRYTHERQIELAFGLYVTDPLAKFVIDSTVDHVIGQGLAWKIDPTEAEAEAERAKKAGEAKKKAAARAKIEAARKAKKARAFAAAGIPEGFVAAPAKEAATPETSDSCGFFLPIPEPAASLFPRKPEDPSPPHVTMLFLGPLTREQFATAAVAARAALMGLRPFAVEMTDYGEFANDDGATIAHMVPRASEDGALEALKSRLQLMATGSINNADGSAFVPAHHPGPWKPHATLAYVAPGAPAYEGPRPTAAWLVTEVELWGFGERVKVPLFGEARAAEADPGPATPLDPEADEDQDSADEDLLEESAADAEPAPDPLSDIEPTVAELEAVIKEHWNDPDNNWPIKGHDRATGLGLWGEQLWPAFVAPSTGRVKLGRIDPRRIDHIRTDPENDDRATHAVLHAVVDNEGNTIGTGAPGNKPRAYQLVNEDSGATGGGAFGFGGAPTDVATSGPAGPAAVSMAPAGASAADAGTTGYLLGEAFYFAVNKVQGAKRGHSDIFHLIDWIDALGNLMFDMLDAAKAQRAFLYDVLLKGASPAQVKSWLREHATPPRPGAVRAHNESELWTPISPELKGSDHAEFVRVFRAHILGGAGIPEHWYGQGDVVNRAGGEKSQQPAMVRLDARRSVFMFHVEFVLRFVIDQAILAGRFGKTADGRRRGTPTTKLRIHVVAPELAVEDVGTAAAALSQGVSALAVAEDRKWVTKDTARAGFASIATHVGVKVDPAQEKAAVEAQESADAESGGGGGLPGGPGPGFDDPATENAALRAALAQNVGGRGVVPVGGAGPGAGVDAGLGADAESHAQETMRSAQDALAMRGVHAAHATGPEEEVTRDEFRAEMANFKAEFLGGLLTQANAREAASAARELARESAPPVYAPAPTPAPASPPMFALTGAQVNIPDGAKITLDATPEMLRHAAESAATQATGSIVEAIEKLTLAAQAGNAGVAKAIVDKAIPVAEPVKVDVHPTPSAPIHVMPSTAHVEVAAPSVTVAPLKGELVVKLEAPAREKREVKLSVDGVDVTGTVG